MSCQEIEVLLDGYVDDELSPEERRLVQRHLADCAACRRTAEENRSLVEAASGLPREVRPGRDLYPEIRDRIERGETGAATGRAKPSARRVRWIALAASLLVVAITGSMSIWLRDDPVRPPSALTPAAGAVLARSDAVEPIDAAVHDYVEAADLLLAAIEERRDRLSPETVEVLEKNLAIVDRAIAEVSVALEADPSSRGHASVLTAMHMQKVELLRRVARLSS